jgi:peptidoglycan/LPS O-acetylase OafA/YrhL
MSASAESVAAVYRSPTARLSEYFSFRRLPGQMPELDGLRGIAVILVLLRHAVRPFLDNGDSPGTLLGWDVGIFMSNGWVGVDLFFVLSGFLITHHILRLHDRNSGNWQWKPYLQKRALRIIPAYYAVLFLAVVGAFPYFEVDSGLLGLRVIYHLLLLQDYLPANIIVAFWSLGVEEKFYLLAPLVILARVNASSLAGRTSTIVMLLFLGIALRVHQAIDSAYIDSYVPFFYAFRSPFHMTMDPILFGVLIALVYRSRDAYPVLTSRTVAGMAFWTGAVLFLVMTCSHEMMREITWWDKTIQPTVVAFAFAAITYGLIFGGGPGAVLRSTVLFVTARVSYSLYLVHMPLVPFALVLADYLVPGNFMVFLAVFVAISLACAMVIHFAVEKPFLIVKDRVGARA